MTREEMLDRARLVQAGRSRSWVQDAQVFAEWILKALEPERVAMQLEIDNLHDRCADLLEKTASLNEQIVDLRREVPTEPDLRHSRKEAMNFQGLNSQGLNSQGLNSQKASKHS